MDPLGFIQRSGIAAALVVVTSVGLSTPAAAQERDRYILVDPIWSAEKEAAGEAVESFDVRVALERNRSLFRLFGEGERAWTSLRMVGDNVVQEANTGPGDDTGLFAVGGQRGPIVQYGVASGSNRFQSFGIPLMWGAPRSEWVTYLQEGVTSLQNVRGSPPGYTVMWNGDIFGRTKDLNGADGLVGTLLSGVTSTADGSCLDHSANLGAGGIDPGFQLLPASNCPPTWSNSGTTWLGDRPVTAETWIELFNEQGADFQFNPWQVPADRKEQSRFLGNNVSSYGHFNDYNFDVLAKFGDVVPGGSGDATREGWPLGLDVVWNSYTFTIPNVVNAKFWEGLFINNSEALYGVPHDYDSLYVGVGMWPGREQDGDNYPIPHKGAWVSAESSDENDATCAALPGPPLIGNSCGGFTARPSAFESGAHGAVVLKSPIGDLRNKLFSDPTSPFYNPGHPLAGDTITYNHAINWNFGNWGDVWNQGSDRQRFGILSSTSENILDGTACGDFFSNSTRWRTFQSPDWPNNQCRRGGFVPGDWTYVSGRPEGAPDGPDTLYMHGCGPNGCPDAWADTVWQGWSTNAFGNLSQFHVGPFRLAAGDTTELFLVFYSGKDSVTFEAFTDGIVEFYLGFFQGPEAPPPVTISPVDIGAGVTPGTDASVQLVWDDGAENYTDPFIAKFADDMEAAPDGTELALIRDANPGLVDRIRERADNNLNRLLVYRSCDGGNTFDANGDCAGDRAIDESGNAIPPGWQSYAVLGPDASGDFPNTFLDGRVTPGVRYLYAILSESVGFEEVVVNDPNFRVETTVGGEDVVTCGAAPCQTENLVVAPSILQPLSRAASDPNVLAVYVPATGAAGGRIARVEFVDRDETGRSTVPFDVPLVSGNTREETFRTYFGNHFEITEWSDESDGVLDSVQVVVEDLARGVLGETGTETFEVALRTMSFKRTDGVRVTLNNTTLVSEEIAAGIVTRIYEIGPGSLDPDSRFAEGFALVEGEGAEPLPLLVSGRLTGDAATPGAFIASQAFPGFLVSADNTPGGNFNQSFYLAENGVDTLSTNLQPNLNLDQSGTTNVPIQGLTVGTYSITFADSVFGNLAPFTLNFGDPAATDEVFDASLSARRAGTTGVTDDEARDLVAAALGEDPADVTLVAANFPFAITNETFGRTAELAMVDPGERPKVLGIAPDTMSVTVAADRWIPTDMFYVIETLNVLRTREVGGEEAIVVDVSGNPEMETKRVLTFAPLNLQCGASNRSCNPVRGSGFGNWVGTSPGDDLRLDYYVPFATTSLFEFVPSGSVQGMRIVELGESIEAQMDSIQVVPNPYLFFSRFEQNSPDRRMMFTHLPPDGELRIYTVSGQFVQEMDWEPDDLTGNGDLYWNMQTREGNEVGPGLYIFVAEATDPATGRQITKRGKFVIIR